MVAAEPFGQRLCGAPVEGSVKYEEVYLRDYETVPALHQGLKRYFNFYNSERRIKASHSLTPAEVHYAH